MWHQGVHKHILCYLVHSTRHWYGTGTSTFLRPVQYVYKAGILPLCVLHVYMYHR